LSPRTEAANYRSPDFDIQKALQNNTLNLRAVLAALKATVEGRGFDRQRVFENDEGAGEDRCAPFPVTACQRGLTWQCFVTIAARRRSRWASLSFPSFWAFRGTAVYSLPDALLERWQAGGGENAGLRARQRPVDLLAAVYAQFARQVLESKTGTLKINPSGYIEKQGDFAQRVANEARNGWAECKLDWRAEDFSETRGGSTPTPPCAGSGLE